METGEHDYIKRGSLEQNVISFLGSSVLLSRGRKREEPGKEMSASAVFSQVANTFFTVRQKNSSIKKGKSVICLTFRSDQDPQDKIR